MFRHRAARGHVGSHLVRAVLHVAGGGRTGQRPKFVHVGDRYGHIPGQGHVGAVVGIDGDHVGVVHALVHRHLVVGGATELEYAVPPADGEVAPVVARQRPSCLVRTGARLHVGRHRAPAVLGVAGSDRSVNCQGDCHGAGERAVPGRTRNRACTGGVDRIHPVVTYVSRLKLGHRPVVDVGCSVAHGVRHQVHPRVVGGGAIVVGIRVFNLVAGDFSAGSFGRLPVQNDPRWPLFPRRQGRGKIGSHHRKSGRVARVRRVTRADGVDRRHPVVPPGIALGNARVHVAETTGRGRYLITWYISRVRHQRIRWP